MTFNTETPSHFLFEYQAAVREGLSGINPKALDEAVQLISETRKDGGWVFVAGNGGSAAISEHLSCDFSKGTHVKDKLSLKVKCLTSNSALLTAIGNDIGYDEVFSYQLMLEEYHWPDTLILISSSGNSPNIVKAAEYAKSKYETKLIGMTGFDGGKLKDLCDISLHIAINNYGVVEDCHQTLMHVLAQYHTAKFKEMLKGYVFANP